LFKIFLPHTLVCPTSESPRGKPRGFTKAL
jgi:hypothetical protein